MKFLATSWSQLAVILAIALVGMAGAITNLESPLVLATMFGLMALSCAGMGVAELRLSNARAEAEAATKRLRREAFEPKPAQLDHELTAIAGLIQSHLESNGRYRESLAEADRNLLPLASPENVRATVHLLIDANNRMRRETSDLARNLEKSRAQVTALRSRLVEATAIGMRDPLTSLGNRRSFDDRLAKEIAQAHARGTDLCLVLGDLDHFKTINDSFGHPFGDRVLKHFAQLLSKVSRAGDTPARLGGEEFALILPHTALDAAVRLTDQIRTQFEAMEWMNIHNGELLSAITASFGIVLLGESDDCESLINRADTMLYEAKRSGRNRIVIQQSLTPEAA
jgi:diguanylate cyclase